MEGKWVILICFYGSLPLLAVVAFALWACARMAGKTDDKSGDGD